MTLPRILIGALLIALGTAFWVWRNQGQQGEVAPLTNEDAFVAPIAPEPLGRRVPLELREGVGTAEPGNPPAIEAPQERVLLCLDAKTTEPIPGISLYRGDSPVFGPTAGEGRLMVGELGWSNWTLWAEGWTPLVLSQSDFPSEVRLERADARVEITLWEATLEHKVTRSQLQMRGRNAVPEGPWTPKLQVIQWDRLGAQAIPPGRYDIYLWISKDMGAPEPYVLQGVELVSGQVARHSIDLIKDKPAAHERDS